MTIKHDIVIQNKNIRKKTVVINKNQDRKEKVITHKKKKKMILKKNMGKKRTKINPGIDSINIKKENNAGTCVDNINNITATEEYKLEFKRGIDEAIANSPETKEMERKMTDEMMDKIMIDEMMAEEMMDYEMMEQMEEAEAIKSEERSDKKNKINQKLKKGRIVAWQNFFENMRKSHIEFWECTADIISLEVTLAEIRTNLNRTKKDYRDFYYKFATESQKHKHEADREIDINPFFNHLLFSRYSANEYPDQRSKHILQDLIYDNHTKYLGSLFDTVTRVEAREIELNNKFQNDAEAKRSKMLQDYNIKYKPIKYFNCNKSRTEKTLDIFRSQLLLRYITIRQDIDNKKIEIETLTHLCDNLYLLNKELNKELKGFLFFHHLANNDHTAKHYSTEIDQENQDAGPYNDNFVTLKENTRQKYNVMWFDIVFDLSTEEKNYEKLYKHSMTSRKKIMGDTENILDWKHIQHTDYKEIKRRKSPIKKRKTKKKKNPHEINS